MFDLQKFRQIAPDWGQRLHYHQELGSTNDEALRLTTAGVANFSVVLADHQLAGRGRRGAPWLSESGAGLLFSLIFKPDYGKEFWSRLSLVSGLGIASVLQEQWNLPAEVKWPNDVLVEDRKCCGILVETRQDYVVIGIGINVTGSPGGEESVAMNELTPHLGSREELLSELLDSLQREVSSCDDSFTEQLTRLREMCYLSGKTITLNSREEVFSGKMTGISDDGALTLLTESGLMNFTQADTIRVV